MCTYDGHVAAHTCHATHPCCRLLTSSCPSLPCPPLPCTALHCPAATASPKQWSYPITKAQLPASRPSGFTYRSLKTAKTNITVQTVELGPPPGPPCESPNVEDPAGVCCAPSEIDSSGSCCLAPDTIEDGVCTALGEERRAAVGQVQRSRVRAAAAAAAAAAVRAGTPQTVSWITAKVEC